MDGHSKGSVTALIFDGVNCIRKSSAGYATYIPLGIGRFYLKILPISEQAKLPPAESPAKYMFFGLMFIYLSIF